MVGTSSTTTSTTTRRALAVGAAVVLLWVGVLVGAFVGGVVVALARPASPMAGAVSTVIAIAVVWVLAVRRVARSVVPRVAGHAYLPATAEVAARLTTIAVVVAAVGVGLLEVGGR
jgi:membrane protein implicated in regulation of membrane protease activity